VEKRRCVGGANLPSEETARAKSGMIGKGKEKPPTVKETPAKTRGARVSRRRREGGERGRDQGGFGRSLDDILAMVWKTAMRKQPWRTPEHTNKIEPEGRCRKKPVRPGTSGRGSAKRRNKFEK